MTDCEAPKWSSSSIRPKTARRRIECRVEAETLWLTQVQLAKLLQTSVPNINLHLKAIYEEGELDEQATINLL